MRKEIIIAIVAGIGVGLINSAISVNTPLKPKTNAVTNTTTGLTLITPNDNQVVAESEIEITGATNPNSIVVVSTQNDNYVMQANKDGSFTTNASLKAGINQILITSFNQENQKTSKLINVIYSSSFFSEQELTSTVGDSTESGEILRQKVQEKLKQISNSPTAFIGTITDKQESTLQLDTFVFDTTSQNANNIAQVAITDQTEFVGLKNEIQFGDLAIGDFVTAMGYVTNGNKVLEAKRIVVSTPPILLAVKVNIGQISAIVGKKATLTTPTETLKIVFGKKWIGPEITELAQNATVLAISADDESQENVVLLIQLTSEIK